MDYQQALEFLNGHTNFEARPADIYSPERFDLERTVQLLAAIGNPQRRFPSVHIAGSKGKGSVAAMTDAILRAAGYRAGLYTSPHLSDIRERLQVDRAPVEPDEFADLVATLAPHVAGIADITYFEIMTCAAFEWFAREDVDVAVLEVGLGGRLDPTNVVMPEVCAITSISLEHTELLGDTVEAIAREKGGILKPGVPVVCAPQQPGAQGVLEAIAAERGTSLRLLGRDWLFARSAVSVDGQQLSVWRASEAGERQEYELALRGPHQAENATVAVAIAHELAQLGWDLSSEHVAAGLRTVEWAARFEILPGYPVVVVDAAHNRASAACLAATMRELFPDNAPVLVFGALRDKDVSGIFAELLPMASHAIMTSVDHPRAAHPSDLQRRAREFGAPVSTSPSVPDAVVRALERAGPAGLVLVTGSVFVAGEARTLAHVAA